MKKRKILLGLALAAAAVFSLSACGDDTTTPADNTPATDTTTPDTPDTPTPDPVTPATETYDVKFMNGSTELTALKQSVEKNAKATKPAKADLPTQTGKRFDFWSADGGVTPYNFDDVVTSAVTLEAVFEDANDYDTLAASENKIVAEDFYSAQVATAEAVSFSSDTVALSTNNADNVITNDNKYDLKKDALAVDFGDKKITTAGILTVYFEMSFVAIANGEAFFQVDGTSATKENTEIFGLRVASGDNRGKFAYRIDNGSDVASTTSAAVNTNYKVKLVLDTADGKASISLDGTTLAEDIAINISAIRGIKFTAKNNGVSEKMVDNVVATFEAKAADPVVTAKAEAAALVTEYKAGTVYTGYNAALKAYVDKAITSFNEELAAATTVAEIDTLKTQFTAFVALDKYAVPVKAYTAANTAATGVDDAYITVIDTMTTETEITTQLGAIAFSGYKITGKYTDAQLTTVATVASVVKDATIYALVASANELSFVAETALASYDKSGAVTDGTVFGDFTLKGTSAKRSNSDTFSLQTNKNATSYLEFSVPTGKTATVSLVVSSTGSSDSTSGPFIYNGDNGVNDSATTESLSGVTQTTLTYSGLAAGTYKIQTKDSNKGLRIYSVTVTLS